MTTPATPHAIISIERPGFGDGQGSAIYDSWEAKGLFKSVDIELSVDQSCRGVINFFDPNYRLIDAFSGSTERAVVKAYLGFGRNLGEPVFKGLLADVGRKRGETTFTVYDMAYVMKLEKKAGYKNRKDDLGIIRDLVTRNSLQFSPPAKALKLEPHKAMMQDEQTDWEHMMERAREAGLHIFVRHDTVFARYPNSYSGTPVLTIEAPKEPKLLNGWEFGYHTLVSRDGKPKVVTHRRRGVAGKRAEGQSSVSTKAEVSHLHIKKDMPAPTKTKLSARAAAQKELEREHAYEGRAETIFPTSGKRPDVLDTVAVHGIGKLLSGDYIVDTARYRFAAGELSMSLDLYRDIKEQ